MPPLLSAAVIVAAAAILLSVQLAACFSGCDQTFSCGHLRRLSYPFTGGSRPSYCGPPEFRLTCRHDLPELTADSVPYRVLQLDRRRTVLTLARLDFWNTTCAPKFANTTLDPFLFDYDGGDNENVTIFYGCSDMEIAPHNQFQCDIGVNSTDAYYLVGPVPFDPVLEVIHCNLSVSVRILKTTVKTLTANRSLLREVMREGFNVSYGKPYEAYCDRCLNVVGGDYCGFDHRPICICGDRLCPAQGKRQVPLIIGVAIGGAAIFGLLLVFGAFLMIQKRRRLVAQTISKDLSVPTVTVPPSSKGLTTSTTNFSQSNPSFPSSKSDLDKGSTYFGVQVFSYTELEEATGSFDSSKELGEGGFGVVYYGVLQDGRVVAVKRLFENNFKRVEQFMNEVEILTRLRHPNLVTLFGCTSRRSRELLLVYEYISNGTVADHLHGKQAESGFLSWPIRLKIAIETADALAYLHKSEIIHRDVKTNNILLNDNFCVKVADFGLSRLFPTDVTHVSTAPQGTPGYVDPEYYQCYQLTTKSDVYSFGVVLTELLSSKQAVDMSRHRHDINLANMAVNRIQNQSLHELVDPCLGFEKDYDVRRTVTSVAELAFRCLQQESDMRPSMDEVLDVLRGIVRKEELNAQKVEIVDDNDSAADGIGVFTSNPPLSPDSTDKRVSSSRITYSL